MYVRLFIFLCIYSSSSETQHANRPTRLIFQTCGWKSHFMLVPPVFYKTSRCHWSQHVVCNAEVDFYLLIRFNFNWITVTFEVSWAASHKQTTCYPKTPGSHCFMFIFHNYLIIINTKHTPDVFYFYPYLIRSSR